MHTELKGVLQDNQKTQERVTAIEGKMAELKASVKENQAKTDASLKDIMDFLHEKLWKTSWQVYLMTEVKQISGSLSTILPKHKAVSESTRSSLSSHF